LFRDKIGLSDRGPSWGGMINQCIALIVVIH
jgi:hypothetical protein